MEDAIGVNVKGLKCDNPKCDYTDMTIKSDDYESWINAKCPNCGEILLTEADYKNTKFLLEIAAWANKIFPKRKPDAEVVTMTVDMNGSGDMNFNIKK